MIDLLINVTLAIGAVGVLAAAYLWVTGGKDE